jgi:hypothetical protein
VKIWTVHLRPGAAPVLVPEAFSWGAALFGPLWLLAHRAWIPGVLVLCAQALVAVEAHAVARGVLTVALVWLLGLFGQDCRRWSLSRRGFALVHVVAGRTGEDAAVRLFDQQPELAREAMA